MHTVFPLCDNDIPWIPISPVYHPELFFSSLSIHVALSLSPFIHPEFLREHFAFVVG